MEEFLQNQNHKVLTYDHSLLVNFQALYLYARLHFCGNNRWLLIIKKYIFLLIHVQLHEAFVLKLLINFNLQIQKLNEFVF